MRAGGNSLFMRENVVLKFDRLLQLRHRSISLNIFSHHLVFLDIFILNIFTISLYLLSFLFLKSREYFDQCEGEQKMRRSEGEESGGGARKERRNEKDLFFLTHEDKVQ